MKFIKEKEIEIVLDENDKVTISTMKGNTRKVIISCNNGALEIDEISVEKIHLLSEEEEAIKAMKEYKKNKK
ncbi:MAG: hypothetical protein HFI08_03345 [Bacilli bacterium]|jgi:hypothetical protein|nr:hypothetical protein [Bacilli bacterium]